MNYSESLWIMGSLGEGAAFVNWKQKLMIIVAPARPPSQQVYHVAALIAAALPTPTHTPMVPFLDGSSNMLCLPVT